MKTRGRFTLIRVGLAQRPFPPGLAVTTEGVEEVQAGAFVMTRIGRTDVFSLAAQKEGPADYLNELFWLWVKRVAGQGQKQTPDVYVSEAAREVFSQDNKCVAF